MKTPKETEFKSRTMPRSARTEFKQKKNPKVQVRAELNIMEKLPQNDCGEDSDTSINSTNCSINHPSRELSITNILRAIDDLSTEPDQETRLIIKCSRRMMLKTDIFWTSPTAILRAIKYSILSRNWDDVTHLLLLLLQHKDHYIPIVQSVCGFMARFNPLVKKLGLQEQFEILNIRRRELNDPNMPEQEMLEESIL